MFPGTQEELERTNMSSRRETVRRNEHREQSGYFESKKESLLRRIRKIIKEGADDA